MSGVPNPFDILMNTLQEMRQETQQNIEQLRQDNLNFQQRVIQRVEAIEQGQDNIREEIAEIRRQNGSNVSSGSTFDHTFSRPDLTLPETIAENFEDNPQRRAVSQDFENHYQNRSQERERRRRHSSNRY